MFTKEKYLEMQSAIYDSLMNQPLSEEEKLVSVKYPALWRAYKMAQEQYIEIDFSIGKRGHSTFCYCLLAS